MFSKGFFSRVDANLHCPLTLYLTIATFNHPEVEAFGKHPWKRRKCSEAFADDNLNVVRMIELVCDRVENIVGKGENAG